MNMKPQLTRHAAIRSQQRCIPQLIIEWLQQFGAEEYTKGAVVRYFDKPAVRQLSTAVGAPIVERLAPYLRAYLIEGDGGRVVTVGYRYQRIRRAA